VINLILSTERLLLRPVTTEDIPAYTKHFVDYEVIRHLSGHIPWPYPDDGVKDWFENHIFKLQGDNRWFWGLFLHSELDELIGGVELWKPGTPENRGFWLGRHYWGNGYMTEATDAITALAFNELGFDKLVFSNAKGNVASARIKQKAGARLMYTDTFSFVDPEYDEREIWELHKQEWKGLM